MSRNYLIIAITFLAICVLIIAVPFVLHAAPERYYQLKWCKSVGGEMETVHGHLRVDCETEDIVAEHDFCKKWREGVVQATEYSDATGKAGVLVLICNKDELRYVDRAREFIRRHRLPISVQVMH